VNSYLLIILTTIGSAAGCGYMAARRGGAVKLWIVCGLVFGPFALPFVLLARPVKKAEKESR
jgi:hypothetical protein